MQRNLIVIIGLIAVVWGLWFVLNRETPLNFSDTTTGLQFSYSPDLLQTFKGDGMSSDGIVARFEQKNEVSGNMLVTVRFEDGFAKISGITKQQPLEIIQDSVRQSYPLRFPKFAEVSQRSYDVLSKPVSEFVFTYNGPSGEEVTQRLVIVMKDSDRALYISAQSLSTEFERLNRRYFNDIVSSIAF